ncbi:MAG TPA: hypothetical protein VJ350_04960 [Methanoregula sp.]|nr:hypothetical protein [Methanoregula sp.]
MMASSLPRPAAENPVSHNLFGLVCSCVRLKTIQPLLHLDRNREFFKQQELGSLILTGENNHE